MHANTFKGKKFLDFFFLKHLFNKFLSKGLADLRILYLHNNKLSALEPKMFSHLTLHDLYLDGNICVDKGFDRRSMSVTTIENVLAECGDEYTYTTTKLLKLENAISQKLGSVEKTISGKLATHLEEMERNTEDKSENLETAFNEIKKTFEHNQETISGKFEMIGKSMETNNGNLATRFEEMEKKFDELKEENAKEVREIKKMMDRIIEMVRP